MKYNILKFIAWNTVYMSKQVNEIIDSNTHILALQLEYGDMFGMQKAAEDYFAKLYGGFTRKQRSGFRTIAGSEIGLWKGFVRRSIETCGYFKIEV